MIIPNNTFCIGTELNFQTEEICLIYQSGMEQMNKFRVQLQGQDRTKFWDLYHKQNQAEAKWDECKMEMEKFKIEVLENQIYE